MPEKLSHMLQGRRPRFLEMHMEGSDAAWTIPVIFDGAGHKTLGEAWRDFAQARGVRPGYLLVFEFPGDGALVGKMFNTHLCRKKVDADSDGSNGSFLSGFSSGEDSD